MSKVTIFRQYNFEVGQKIRIEGSNRRGDWLVIGTDGRKVTLRCPVSGREFSWNPFCYLVEERENETWPRKE